MTYSLYLDDERDPKTKAPVGEWKVFRSCADAMVFIQHDFIRAWPGYISLDHDLGENKKSGMDFVKLFCDYHMRVCKTFSFPGYNVHSANPPGRDNMLGYLDNYIRLL